MSLNIKDERTHELVRELARRTGSSQTAAVREAVEHRLAELSPDSDEERSTEWRRAAVQRLVREFQDALTDEDRKRIRSADRWLYDDNGLPR
jgi:antitoxin VapB